MNNYHDYNQDQAELQQQIQQLESTVRNYLDKDAIERYNNLKTAHQELAVNALVTISQLIQNGQIREMISDEQFRQLLAKLNRKKNFRIKRK